MVTITAPDDIGVIEAGVGILDHIEEVEELDVDSQEGFGSAVPRREVLRLPQRRGISVAGPAPRTVCRTSLGDPPGTGRRSWGPGDYSGG